jgi:hypothetical protein
MHIFKYAYMFICSCVLLGAGARAAGADSRGDAVVARARAVEQAQLAALAGTTLTMQTVGVARNGKTLHAMSAVRKLSVARDGQIGNEFVAGKLDGKIVSEAELRHGTGAPPKPPRQAEALTVALAPLTASDVTVQAIGPSGDGGYRLRCDVHREASIDAVELIVDEQTGKKRSAVLRPAGRLVKLANRAELVLAYADDGTPARLESHFAARVLWIDRAVDMTTIPTGRARQ